MFNGPRYPMHRRRRFLFLPVVIVMFFILTALVQYLWNTVLPQVVHARPVTYWQAAALLLLSRILFGRLHFGRRGGRPGWGGPQGGLREKWMNMNDEERQRFKEAFKARGHHQRP